MSNSTTKPKNKAKDTKTTDQNPATNSNSHSEWIQSALLIIQAGREAELQHRQTVADMKAMTDMLDMQASFPATIMAVSALVRDNEMNVAGKAFIERVLWDTADQTQSAHGPHVNKAASSLAPRQLPRHPRSPIIPSPFDDPGPRGALFNWYRLSKMKPLKPFNPACDRCRIKKSACDRVKPVCQRCTNSGWADSCFYRTKGMAPVQNRNPKRVQTHHPRSSPMVVIQSPSNVDSYKKEDVSSRADSDEEDSDSDDSDDPRAAKAVPDQDGQHNPVVIDLSSSPSDESFHTAILPRDPPSTTRDPGSRSSRLTGQKRAIHEQVRQRIRDGIGEDSPLARRGLVRPNRRLSLAYDPKCRQSSEQISPDLADHLVAAYLAHEYVNLPIFDLDQFHSSYSAIRMGRNIASGSTPFHGLLITIFSLSGLSWHDVGETDIASLFNYGQSVSRDLDSRSTLTERAQACILQSQYLYASGSPRAALISIGSVVRIVQVLGLESRTQDQNARRIQDKELARRIWHSAMLLERIIALQLRLPPHNSQLPRVSLPTHMETDYADAITKEVPSPDAERASIIEFLAASVGLYEHVEDILTWEEETQMRQGSCAAKKLLCLNFSPFARLDGALYQWQTSLSPRLQKPGLQTRPTHPIIHRQRSIIRARYLYVRLRLYRPLLILGLAACEKCSCQVGSGPHFVLKESSPDCPIALTVVRDSSLKCITAALELLNLCEREQDSMPPCWENIDYLYACGTVFLAAQSCPFVTNASPDQPGPEEMELSLGRVLTLLEGYQSMQSSDRIYNIAQRCRRTLESVSGIIEGSDEAAVFGEDNSRRLLERMNMCSPHSQGGNTQSDSSRLTLFGWLSSLPNDLTGDLE
ncbi:transcription factor domain-containing protein [Aspergillus affinis]|uniref:transcription factor domain-containing protein n=1 Tax=Aspergillus affinis TaxID=1070780 RepID=UPI0022FDB995|nr:uncharacterized protein KD926_006263 [Aspergillus affinis]KAI9041926.1 hypothetical protein KD926_006263 [Aspergillus affinis]